MKILQDILERCDLDEPDGRPLHRYLVTDEEHERLGRSLGLMPGGFRNPSVKIAQAFVLWASEHIRREYPGNILSWDFVFTGLNLDYERALAIELTEAGLVQWRRPLRYGDAGHRQFLYSLLAEGGLPDLALANAARYGETLLALIRQLEAEGALGAGLSHSLAMRAAGGLPQVLRTKEQALLLAELAQALVELRRSLPEGLPPDSIMEHLDAQHPGWRDQLPLRLSPRSLEALIRPALEQERVKTDRLAPLVRRELRLAEGQQAWLGLASVGDGAILPWTALPGDNQHLRLRLIAEDGSGFLAVPDEGGWKLARSRGSGALDLPLAPDQPAVLAAYADGSAMGEVMLDTGLPSPDDTPSLWRAVDSGDPHPHVLVPLSGRGQTRASRAFVLAAKEALPRPGPGITIGEPSPGPGGQVWPVSGTGHIHIGEHVLALATGAEVDAPDIRLLVLGKTIAGLTLAGGGLVYLGEPQVLGGEGDAWPKALGRNLVRRPLPRILGGEVVEWHDDGVLLARARIVTLPADTQFSVQDHQDSRQIHLTAAGLRPGWMLRLSVSTSEVAGQIKHDGTLTLELTCPTPQSLFDLRIVDPQTGAALDLQGIWPAKTPRLVAPSGEIISANASVSHAALTGWRGLMPAGGGVIQFRIANDAPVAVPAHGTERIAAHSELIAQSLSLEGADGRLNLRLVAGGQETPRLEIGWYDWEPEKAGPFHHLGAGNTLLRAVLLDDPVHTEQTTATSRIDMAGWLGSYGDGLWFVQGNSDKRGVMRPFVWQSGRMTPGTRDERLSEYAQEWAELLERPDDPGWVTAWQRIRALRTAGSAVALDQVQALDRVPAAAAVLLLIAPRSDRASALALETEMRIWWPLVSVADWTRAIEAQKQRLTAGLQSVDHPVSEISTIVSERLMRVLGEIVTLRPELSGHLGLAMMAAGEPALALGPDGKPVPLAVPNAQETLNALAQDAARRFDRLPDGTSSQRAHHLHLEFKLNEWLLPLLHAPLIVAEVAMGWRAHPSPQETLQLLALRFTDPAWFDAALPAAMSLAQERAQ